MSENVLGMRRGGGKGFIGISHVPKLSWKYNNMKSPKILAFCHMVFWGFLI